jgi:branched-chain amino acid transport system substrate-binding protein
MNRNRIDGASRPARYIALLAVTLTVSAAALCGCSSGSSQSTAVVQASNSPGSATSQSPSAQSAASQSVIPVGVIGSYSGPEASNVAPSRPTVEAWADSVNAAGGIDGHQVRLFVEDDQGSVQTSVQEVKQLVQDDHVVALVAEASSSGDAAWAPYVAKEGIPVVGGITQDTPFITNPDFFAAAGNLIASFYGTAAVAAKNGARFGELYCAEITACAGVVPILNSVGNGLGVKIAYSGSAAATAADYTADCVGLKDASVQSYGLALASSVLRRVQDQCVQQGVTAPLIVTNAIDSSFLADPSFNGTQLVEAVHPFWDDTTPAGKAMHAALAKYAPSVGSATMPINGQVSLAWGAGLLFEAAVKAAGPGAITSASIKRGLYALKGDTLGGFTAPLTFKPGQPNLINCYYTFAIKDGMFTAPDGLGPKFAPTSIVNKVAASF